MKSSKRARVQQGEIVVKIKSVEITMQNIIVHRFINLCWYIATMWGLHIIPDIIKALK